MGIIVMSKISFNVLSFRKNYEDDSAGKKESGSDKLKWAHYTAIVDLREVPRALEEWREVNLRDTNLKGDVYNAITGTVKNSPETFLRKNRGITILAAALELNKANDQLTLEMEDPSLHGIVDGGHTYTAIKEARNENTHGYVAMHIMTGIDDLREVVDIVDARNRSRSAQAQSLDNLVGVYKPIKEALAGFPYADKISYSEYEVGDDKKRKPISIREILSYIYAVNPEDHKGSDHPIAAYSAKGAVVDYFSPPPAGADKSDAGGKGYSDKVIEKAAPLLPSILSFVDFLYKEVPDAYNGQTPEDRGRFGALSTMGVKKREVQLDFGGGSADYDYPDAFLYPVLAAFRKKIVVKKGKWEWDGGNPEAMWIACKEGVGDRLRQLVDKEDSPNRLGKSRLTWSFIADAIQ